MASTANPTNQGRRQLPPFDPAAAAAPLRQSRAAVARIIRQTRVEASRMIRKGMIRKGLSR
jgi:hypothetical protein